MKYSEYIRELKEVITNIKISENNKKECRKVFDVILFLILAVGSLILPSCGIIYF